jgi:hypothetical protein
VAFTGIELGVQGAHTLDFRWHAPSQVATRGLDLDHLRAEIRQQPAASRPGDDL